MLALLAGCYATTPHRAEVTAPRERAVCDSAVGDVMTRAGLVPLTPPPRYSMLFGPRTSTPSAAPDKPALTGIGVVVREAARGADRGCSVTLEAVSTDASCPTVEPPECYTQYTRAPSQFGTPPYSAAGSSNAPGACGLGPLTCEMGEVPGLESTVDDLARRVRDALGPTARVQIARAE
jgi:hypothetical protein